jgi:hypothetical protein
VEIVRQPPTVEIKGEPPRWKLFAKLFWLTTKNESVKQISTQIETRLNMTNDEAIKNVREMGHIFAVSLTTITGKSIDDKSDLMNGLAAYEVLKLKGEFDWVDESVDIVLRIVYNLAKEQLEKVK